ncbi:50S ribosome-binding GTPase [Acinetobacter baumannii]|uniref:GTPase n=1 Tax=Acinetobacter baumannii TaxID=470 RepID=UPI00233EAFD7|nr:GTPase [Acinetobacter baumannii]MDC5481351.1 50S ribosome-binding GTPase [Acinetobacter baumannii]MDK2107205.1 50S ribosome-binding GTPase [Acinetobacter baumannii]MDK2112540.1 50S ribosome-binding GTPase [Acinetobacter baumannii]MDK2142051.1 50S ribosome-binding GTPase [Acinetobacter baumannii]MDK2152650.1 50S ribosome-binding GTPase [Acinetobacter baumannii]
MNAQTNFNADAVQEETQKMLNDLEANLDQKVTIAVVGKVSAGKSSLLNALFHKTRNDTLATVGATSGVTTKVKRFALSKNVEIMDSPGLGDILDENSAETRQALLDIDVGILVVADSADTSQKEHFDLLKQYCKHVFVVLNKIDIYDRQKGSIPKVVAQWKEALGLAEDEQIFQTCTFGYDPDSDEDTLDIRGVDGKGELREKILDFLEQHGKNLILAREMERKSVLARRIIFGALAAVGAQALIPGSALYITGTQAAAIMSIHYIYTGEVLSTKSAVATLPLFASQNIGSTAFIWAKSILPPTGILDAAAAGVAIVVTLAMLSAVNWIYENGYNLDDKSQLKDRFNEFKELLDRIGAKEIAKTILSRDAGGIMELIKKFVK